MTRSDARAEVLVAAGAQPHRGSLKDLESLQKGVAEADGVIHLAFDHDFSNFLANCEKDRRAIGALGAGLTGSDRPLLITSGTGMGTAVLGEPATEDVFNLHHPNSRSASVMAGPASPTYAEIPLSETYAKFPIAVKAIGQRCDDGANRWPAAHVVDVALLYRLALERQEAGAVSCRRRRGRDGLIYR